MASSTEYMDEINKLTSKIDTLTNELTHLNKDDVEFLPEKGKLANIFLKDFGNKVGKGDFVEFEVIVNLKNRLKSEKKIKGNTEMSELIEEIRRLTNKCRIFKNLLVGKKY